MQHIVMFSGGVGSWAAAKRVAKAHGTENLVLLFTDTLIEDEDLYRFIVEAAENVGGDFVRIADGRTPWEVFRDVRMIGNTRIDPCSYHLKRKLARKWIEENTTPDSSIIYVGIDWTEVNRLAGTGSKQGKGSGGMRANWFPWRIEAPMTKPPYLSKSQMIELLRAEGIAPPRLYEMGFPHNNCGGFCIKAGQSHFAHLLRMLPERYAEHEQAEEDLRQELHKDISILRDRTGGETSPMTLRAFRVRLQDTSGKQVEMFDWGGCGCFE